MATITCVTTRYLPNMRHIARLFEADEIVVLDLAPLPSRSNDSFVSRNRIAEKDYVRQLWLTVPVLRTRGLITKNALIDFTDDRWKQKHIGRIKQCYPHHGVVCPSFIDSLQATINSNDGTLLDLNLKTIELLTKTLAGDHAHKRLRLQSSLVEKHTGGSKGVTELSLNHCVIPECQFYAAGTYVDDRIFVNAFEKFFRIANLKID